MAGCLSTSPFLSLLCVTRSGDLIVSCLITETHRLPLIPPSGPEVSKGDDSDQPQSLQHTKEFLANGGSSGIEPPYWRILWGQLPLKSYQLGSSSLSTLSPVSLGFRPWLKREYLCSLEWWGNRSHAEFRGESHSIADVVPQNPKPLEGKLFQLPELVCFTTQLVYASCPARSTIPFPQGHWWPPHTQPCLPDLRVGQSCSSETRYCEARAVHSRRGQPSSLIQWKGSFPQGT